ncbi:MAG: acylneuraminate cytidylyltransferase family protein [Chitinophagaceae bacterium]|nr:acylneuraminate cytidylyltransferase family protein [Chitinophagaceae bacterium]
MNFLFVIPARGGSKGIPGKNIKLFDNKPLIYYSIELARLFTSDQHICVSTDSQEIAACVSKIGLEVPFLRPPELASDNAGTLEVLQHAIAFYQSNGRTYDALVLLQPTSPFREEMHLREAMAMYNDGVDMVVSVKESAANPYFNLFEEDSRGFLVLSKEGSRFNRRQDMPKVYEYNGSIYIVNIKSLLSVKSFVEFSAIRKYVMGEKYSIDLDTPDDWEYAEYLIRKKR